MSSQSKRISTILLAQLTNYKKSHRLTAQQSKVLGSLSKCQTGALGRAEVSCECGEVYETPLSCRDRHCPRCQSAEAARWTATQTEKLLPVPYYHVIFTIAQELHLIFQYNRESLYNELFASSVASLQSFALKDRRLGVKLGILAVLHTWGQMLWFHPHIHMIVAGGGLTDQGHWKQIDPTKDHRLCDVKALSKDFKSRLIAAIRRLHRRGELTAPPQMDLQATLDEAEQLKWSVFIQYASAGPEKVASYFGRYVRKVAIGESRLLETSPDAVSFTYKDYRTEQSGVLTLTPEEFIHRFVEHILPLGFRRIRCYGWRHHDFEKAKTACKQAALATFAAWKALAIALQREDERHQQYGKKCDNCGCPVEHMSKPILFPPDPSFNDSS
ncbi:MAG: IS91 family transposase [Opitutaceae bacterium]